MSAHEKEVLKRWGFPALMILAVGIVWWYFYKRGQSTTVLASNIPNASQSGAPVYNYYGPGNGGTQSTGSTVPAPAPTLPITTQTPQSDVTPISPNGAIGVTQGGMPDISRLIYNTANPFSPPANLIGPNSTQAGGGTDHGCGCGCGCGADCGAGSTRYTDSTNTVVAASPAQQSNVRSVTSSGIGGLAPGPADWMYQNQIAAGIAALFPPSSNAPYFNPFFPIGAPNIP